MNGRPQAITLCSQFDTWLAAHLTDFLHHGGLLDPLRVTVAGGEAPIELRDYFLLEYGAALLAHPTLWQCGVAYLRSAPAHGLATLETVGLCARAWSVSLGWGHCTMCACLTATLDARVADGALSASQLLERVPLTTERRVADVLAVCEACQFDALATSIHRVRWGPSCPCARDCFNANAVSSVRCIASASTGPGDAGDPAWAHRHSHHALFAVG